MKKEEDGSNFRTSRRSKTSLQMKSEETQKARFVNVDNERREGKANDV